MDAVEPELRKRLLDPAIDLAEHLPVGTFRRKLRKLVDTVRAATLSERHERAMRARRTWVEPVPEPVEGSSTPNEPNVGGMF
jgi:hypothetical protein